MTKETNEATIPAIADRVFRMESMLADAEAVLKAIQMAGLLEGIPANEELRPHHSTGIVLLDQLLERITGSHTELDTGGSFMFHNTSEEIRRIADEQPDTP